METAVSAKPTTILSSTTSIITAPKRRLVFAKVNVLSLFAKENNVVTTNVVGIVEHVMIKLPALTESVAKILMATTSAMEMNYHSA